MDRMFERMQSMWDFDADSGFRGRGHAFSVDRDGDDYLVVADLPGFEKEELDVRYDDGVLTIEGEHDVSDTGVHHARHVYEQLHIPGDVVAEDITASYHNGVLEVRLPLESEADDDGHTIDIE